ncbi:hypothetical protein [Kozakia baliensis]|uniref:hypothetical protein n=1 Tax=Kozakia baliensis TaxID=153496 RepID=UPI0004980555|nr:hypothetical protein [Kozakia baliensis]
MTMQDGWQVFPMQPDLDIEISPAPEPAAPPVQQQVEALWAAAVAQNPQLYNGRIFCADVIEADRIIGHWSDYRPAFAQMKDPNLYPTLKLRPLAVNGLFHAADGIVLGRRKRRSLYLGAWRQSVPSGSVEARAGDEASIDLHAQILVEIEEELGLTADLVKSQRCLLACEHELTHIVDIGIELHCSLPFSEIEHIWRERGNDEYEALERMDDIERILNAPDVVPTTKAMLKMVHA